MSRRAIKPINWAAVAELVSEGERPSFLAFRAKSDQYLRRMNAYPEAAPKIDWEYYKKNISNPSLVENFKKQYESLSIPYPADKYTSQFDAEEKELASKIQQFIKESDEHIASLKEEMKKINNTIPETEMTMEEYWTAYPEAQVNAQNPSAFPHTEEAQPDHPINFEKTEH